MTLQNTKRLALGLSIGAFGGLLGWLLFRIAAYALNDFQIDASLAHVAAILSWVCAAIVFLTAIAGTILRRTGVFPPPSATPPAAPRKRRPLRSTLLTFLFWIVVALVLVFLYNLVMGPKASQHSPLPPQLGAFLLDAGPIILLLGVWVFFYLRLRRTQRRQGPDT